ncbi:MAG TPA: phytase [Lysobacter sp.]|nr:phytase [Lysobacter sp.]
MRLRLVAPVAALLLCSCALAPVDRAVDREPDETAEVDPLLSAAQLPHQVVVEAFVTAATPEDNIDSPAAWRAPDGKLWLYATAKKTDHLVIYDGDSGMSVTTYGSSGAGTGQFRRPNGIAVHDDLLFVVERDNHRVQVLALPSLRSLAMFGDTDLVQPYGLWVRERDAGVLEVLVTDAYMAGKDAAGEDLLPPLAQLDRRVQRYELRRTGDALTTRHLGHFGDTSAAGAIRVPESIWGDPAHDRLLIAEEDLPIGTSIREYDLEGRYRDRTIGLGQFKAQAEGIALWACPDGSGYWLTTDQFKDRSLFNVFDRQSLRHLGAFAGTKVGNTDGVWLHQAATTRFPQGVFYAVHDDMAVGAFDWRDIAKALGLRATCGAN